MSDNIAIKQAHEDELLLAKYVNGVGVGMKWVNGEPTNQQAILVFVEKKVSKNNLINKYSEAAIIPEEIDGVPTDVIEVGYIQKQGLKTRVRPIKPGYSCGHSKITAGTIGGVFIDRDGDPVILSNNHVLSNENNAEIGDIIYQPGPADGSGNLQFKGWDGPAAQLSYFGTLKNFVKLGATDNSQDSAIARIHERFIQSGMVDQFYPVVNQSMQGYNVPEANMQVQKVGRTTGFTTGRIIGTHASFTVGYDFGEARFNDCVVCSAMSKGGDSGSVIFDMNMRAVALLFAGSPKVTIATPIQPVIDHYGLELWNTTPMPSIELDDGAWTLVSSQGTITPGPDSIKLVSPANCCCFFQRSLSPFKEISVTVNTGTDKGATWGPGVSIIWPNGILKVNLRHGGGFAGVVSGNESLGIGKVQPNTEYVIRIRKTNTSYVGEVLGNNKWNTVVEIPHSVFPSSPLQLVVGKTNMIGYSGDYSPIGAIGECSFRDLNVK